MATAEAILEWTDPEECVADWSESNVETIEIEKQPTAWTKDAATGRAVPELNSSALDREIEVATKRILSLPANWDGEGSAAYERATLERAILFLRLHLNWLWECCGVEGPIPQINPGPDGSIDLYWKQPSWELLINIPADANQHASFYGDDAGTHAIKGSFDSSSFNLGLIPWLMK